MSTETEIAAAVADAVSTVLREYRPQLIAAALGHDQGALANQRHDDNFLSRFDLELHDRYKVLLTETLGELIYLSEEADPETIGLDPDLVVLVDPLDTSELAVRAINGYTHVLVWSRSRRAPVAAAVGDFFHEIDLYTAIAAAAQLHTRSGDTLPIVVKPPSTATGRLLVTNYNMRPSERFLPLARQTDLIAGLTNGLGPAATDGPTGDKSRIGVDFGSVGLCHVATGATDAFIEFAKGFALWDLLPGQLILEAAGGVVTDLEGNPLAWPTEAFTDLDTMNQALTTRQTFVAAASLPLARSLARVIN